VVHLGNIAELAWQAGLVACFGSGLIEFIGLGGEALPPRAPCSIAFHLYGIAITFIAIGLLPMPSL